IYPAEGNYWSDYESTSYDEKGIGKTPHEGRGFIDYYPLINPIEDFDILTVDILKPENRKKINSSNITVSWSSKFGVGNMNYSIRLNQNKWIDLANKTTHTFNGLPKGENIVVVMVEDEEGCTNSARVTFIVDYEERTFLEKITETWWLIPIFIILILSILIIIYRKFKSISSSDKITS
ncbi:MAG: hypothetical protein ACOC85_05775, partial [Thermoplasmatota archaeon]